MAFYTTSPTFSKTTKPSSFMTLSSTASHSYKICPKQSHQTLVCSLLLREELTNLGAIRTDNANYNYAPPQQPPRSSQRPGNNSNLRFNNH